ncbi:MAG: SIS domain-containing protein [Planctomycetota bacterium]|nr:SIS domain-containing protein [Planctomycetota bacterium]
MNWQDIQIILNEYPNGLVKEVFAAQPGTAERFLRRILGAGRIFICGNGGSLSTASHLALDWGKVGGKEVICFNNPDIISAYSNDCRYENIFIEQLNRFKVADTDVILIISTSGNSPNVSRIVDVYPAKNILLMTGRGQSRLVNMADITIKVPSDNIRIIEDAHLGIGHFITEIMERMNDTASDNNCGGQGGADVYPDPGVDEQGDAPCSG